MPTWDPQDKSASPTWNKYHRWGKDTDLGSIESFKFTDSLSEDGAPIVEDAVISDLSPGTQTWTKQNKS